MRSLIFFLLFSFICFHEATSAPRNGHEYDYLEGLKNFPIEDLDKYADGVQLEGGYVFKEKLTPNQKYANVSVVWDLPFKGLEATEAFSHGKEKFRESRLENFNEHQVINLISNLILYYLKQLETNQKCVFIFYVGKKTALNLFEVVERVIRKYDVELKIEKDENSGIRIGSISDKKGHSMEFIAHYSWISSKVFKDASYVVGFSYNGGFNKAYNSGDIVIPTKFIDIAKGRKFSLLFLKGKYEIKNDFQDNLPKFLKSQDPKLVEILNGEFKSENPLKASHKAKIFEEKDFNQKRTLLGTWDIFEPTLWPKVVVIPD
jgi:hypothetical protein